MDGGREGGREGEGMTVCFLNDVGHAAGPAQHSV